MYSNRLKKIIIDFKDKSKIKLRTSPFYKELVKETNFLPVDVSINRRLYHILNNTKDIPICIVCNSNVNWYREHNEYHTYCSTKCVSRSKNVRDKYKSTCLKRYGKINISQTKGNKEKVTNSWKNKSENEIKKIVTERKSTCLKKYFADNPLKVKEFQKKVTQTNLKKYGVEYPMQSKHIQKKARETIINHYGVDHISKSETIQEKRRQTFLKKYGVDCNLKLKSTQETIKNTNLKKYGVEYSNQKHLSKDTLNKLKDKDYLKYQHHNLKKNLDLIASELGLANCSSISIYFKKYKIPVLTHPVSEAEKEVFSFIKSIYSKEIITNSRSIITPLELDIYLPKDNLAIEFNGIYWHSDKIKDNNYHFNKSKICNSKDIKLIHIFEDEWDDNKLNIKYWLKKYLNKDKDFITKDLLIKDLDNSLELSLNWPINYEKLEGLGYILDRRLAPEKRTITFFKIYDCGKVKYVLKSS